MGLRDIEMTLPPGFRFYPSDEELVCHYLHSKVANQRFAGGGGAAGTMVEVDLHVHEPWELPDDGAQEQEIPGVIFCYAEIIDDQE